MIFYHYLAVTNWSLDFVLPIAKADRTLVWIRFPGLNLVHYDESFLLAMASAVGRPVKVDRNTLKVERGLFARICIKVGLTQPVVGKVWLKGHWYKVEYEGLYLICASCGRYGHLARSCSLHPNITPVGSFRRRNRMERWKYDCRNNDKISGEKYGISAEKGRTKNCGQ